MSKSSTQELSRQYSRIEIVIVSMTIFARLFMVGTIMIIKSKMTGLMMSEMVKAMAMIPLKTMKCLLLAGAKMMNSIRIIMMMRSKMEDRAVTMFQITCLRMRTGSNCVGKDMAKLGTPNRKMDKFVTVVGRSTRTLYMVDNSWRVSLPRKNKFSPTRT